MPYDLDDIVKAISVVSGVDMRDIISASKQQDLVDVRAAAIILGRQQGYSYDKIGFAMRRDHTTVINAIFRTEQLRAKGDGRARYRDEIVAKADALLASLGGKRVPREMYDKRVRKPESEPAPAPIVARPAKPLPATQVSKDGAVRHVGKGGYIDADGAIILRP